MKSIEKKTTDEYKTQKVLEYEVPPVIPEVFESQTRWEYITKHWFCTLLLISSISCCQKENISLGGLWINKYNRSYAFY